MPEAGGMGHVIVLGAKRGLRPRASPRRPVVNEPHRPLEALARVASAFPAHQALELGAGPHKRLYAELPETQS